ncbi:DUF4007 family protein [Alkalihalobacterium chitinilyticum]|uniref:DUF4007 family protein n=1 Tax=Alkalihalobacterium chitinilyticum TaxID=2980103 RepID=A0ABT5VG85_9BACI|nr:DUF4007 family protein [Alkalihalobacterium chitinilyticum]MDE5414181.1 DUF4007 family protein [Alkalihalobacterium chitinilyticum]
MGYGQHQSFYLRDRWLNKAVKHISSDERFFYDKEAFEKIGLGKNMVQSLRFWVVATGVVEETYNDERKKTYHLTKFGEIINKYDKFIQFNDTASIIHYHLAKEKEPSTIFYWFFNILRETIISKDELLEQFISWVKTNEEKPVSERSLKRDIDCLVKLYTAGQNTDDPEEVILSPINKVNLLRDRKGVIYKQYGDHEKIGLAALMFTLLDYRERKDVEVISVEEIATNAGLWGNVFNMNRSAIVNALEHLTNHPKYSLKFTRTNNLDTVRLPNILAMDYLEFEYKRKVEALVW